MIVRIIFCLLLSFSTAVMAQERKPVQLADDAPDSYVVVKGDTLWHISGRFLKEPWRWPEVWRLNREQIRNPHLIYPGQIVVLDRDGLTLRIGRRVGDRLSPQVYDEGLGDAIPAIPHADIEPFLSQPLIVDEPALAGGAKIVATQEDRVMVGANSAVYAAGVTQDVAQWQIYRPAKPVLDPVTKEVLGYEAKYLGTARVSADGEPATLEVTTSVQEIGKGDRLVPADKPDVLAYAPHAPEADVKGRIVSLYNGVGETGRNSIVTLNLGKRDGMEVGHVLALYRASRDVVYREGTSSKKELYTVPEERYGLVFVFRVFDRLSYALVMNSSRTVTASDVVRKP